MFKFLNKKEAFTKTLTAFATGQIKDVTTLSDPIMAQETMGPSIVIDPSDNTVVAPFAGKILFVFPTKHAIGLKREDGLEVLLHIGIDTVELNGKHFKSFVKAKQTVKQNQKLIELDVSKIKEVGYDTSIVCIFTSKLGQSIPKPENKSIKAAEYLLEL